MTQAETQVDVFISYSSRDREWVRDNLLPRIERAGLRAFIDFRDFRPGALSITEMERGVRECRKTLMILTPDYLDSEWAEFENIMAQTLSPANRNLRLIPLLKTKCDKPLRIAALTHIDFTDDADLQLSWQQLLNSLRSPATCTQAGSTTSGSSPTDAAIVHAEPRQEDSLTVIIPIYNERQVLEDLVTDLRDGGLLNKYPIIMCDDASTDNSFALMQECASEHPRLRVLRNMINARKVGAIRRMAQMVRTRFTLTLDADCALKELRQSALHDLMAKMRSEGISASYFRIIPDDRDWLGRLQKLDYSFFSDALRRILGVPVCLIGQGVLWKTEDLLKVLSQHSGQYDGDDLENTVIALNDKMKLHWERSSVILRTKPKRTVVGLLRQRALSWDFGMFRVLCRRRALRLAGESGAFYKNLLLIDGAAHPFKLIAIPMLLSVPLINLFGSPFLNEATYDIYRRSLTFSLKYGAWAMSLIWIATIVNSLLCVRKFWPTVKWALFSAAYLASPFVYFLFYPLLRLPSVNVYDTTGAAIHWVELGLLLTYIWWVLLAFGLLCMTSLDGKTKRELLVSTLLAPVYYFALLVICRTVGLLKFMVGCVTRLFGRAPN